MEEGQYLTTVCDPSWEEDALKIVSSLQEIDDLLRAAERLAQRFAAKRIFIPMVPGTDVYVFRLDPGIGSLPSTRWFFRIEGIKAVFIAVEAIIDEEDAE
jgi:hypothetical protein